MTCYEAIKETKAGKKETESGSCTGTVDDDLEN